MLEKIDRFLFHRWVQRAAVVSFLAGAVSFVFSWVTHTLRHADLWGVLGVVLMAAGFVVLAAAWLAGRSRHTSLDGQERELSRHDAKSIDEMSGKPAQQESDLASLAAADSVAERRERSIETRSAASAQIQEINRRMVEEHERQQRTKRDQTQKEAEAQLAAAIRVGHVLTTLTAAGLPLVREWMTQTAILVKEGVGELEAARLAPGEGVSQRLKRLDELAGHVRTAVTRLTRSKSWAAHVDSMRSLSSSLALSVGAGQGLRKILFENRTMDAGEATRKVDEWRSKLDLTVRMHGEGLWEMLVPDMSDAGAIYGRTGMTPGLSAVVTRLEKSVKPLETMLEQVDTYVKALDTAATPRQSTAQS